MFFLSNINLLQTKENIQVIFARGKQPKQFPMEAKHHLFSKISSMVLSLHVKRSISLAGNINIINLLMEMPHQTANPWKSWVQKFIGFGTIRDFIIMPT